MIAENQSLKSQLTLAWMAGIVYFLLSIQETKEIPT